MLTNTSGQFVLRDVLAGSPSVVTTLPGYVNRGYGHLRPDGHTRPLLLRADGRRTHIEIRGRSPS